MEIVNIAFEASILVGSDPIGEEGGEIGGKTVDTETPGWDDQF